jgi:hypothetical protein
MCKKFRYFVSIPMLRIRQSAKKFTQLCTSSFTAALLATIIMQCERQLERRPAQRCDDVTEEPRVSMAKSVTLQFDGKRA